MDRNSPERMTRAVVEACAVCDACRYLMDDTPCRVFPELFRLYDKEAEKQGEMTSGELRNLVGLCNFCALCPCPDVRSNIMKAKHAFVSREGLAPTIRLLEDISRLAGICGAYPRLTNSLLQGRWTSRLLKTLTGIHRDRDLPRFPKEDFAPWARRRELHVKRNGKRKKVAYFAGCTAQYLFPDVPKAVVDVLQRNEIDVYLPEQKCCGMPSLLEGDIKLALEFVTFNLGSLCEAVDSGYEIVCSCPTCSYMLKHVISEGGYYAQEYRESAGSNTNESGKMSASDGTRQPGTGSFMPTVMDKVFKDEGYFASVSALKRIEVANHTFDLGEYLRSLLNEGEFNNDLGTVPTRMAYYPPCHLREQEIGEPFADLVQLVPGFPWSESAVTSIAVASPVSWGSSGIFIGYRSKWGAD